MVNNLRYADDVVLIATSPEDLQELMDRVRASSEKVGLLINTDKTRRAWQSQTWGRPAPQVWVQNQFQEDEIPLAVMAGRIKKFSENTSMYSGSYGL